MAALLEIDALCKRYGALAAVDGVSFALAEGEALGIIGPNGAGKSTIFNLIAGDVAPDSGQVRFAGRDITRLPAHARCRAGIGRSYQIPHPMAKMTVFENLLVGAIFGGRLSERAAEQRCGEVLALAGLLERANQPAGTLTLLQRKRLELARALATGPRLLLLDEIGGGLTERELRELVATIGGIRAQGTAIVWIEHVVHALVSVVSRLLVMNFGRLLAEGKSAAVMADPVVREVYMGIPAS